MTTIRTLARRGRIAVFSCVAVIGLVACASTELYELTDAEVPADWLGPVDLEAQLWPNMDWWNNFDSPELTSLIEEALEYNFNLERARNSLRTAELAMHEAGLDLIPAPSASISTSASTSRNEVGGSTVSSGSSGDFGLNISASYSGILSKPLNYENDAISYEGSLISFAETRLSIYQSVASTYFNLLLLRDRVVAAELNLENAESVLRITQARYDAGLITPIDVLSQRITVESQRSSLRSLYQQDLTTRGALAILLGRGVQGFDVEGTTLENIAEPKVRPGLPSELLLRRPDLVRAELNLRTSTNRVDLARLSFFPSISLTASAGSRSPALVDVVTSAATTNFSLGANLAMTLLDMGQRKRNVERARLALEDQILSYRETILRAFNEIEYQLSNMQLVQLQAEISEQNLEAANESFRLAQVRYDAGVDSFQQLLQAQTTLFGQRNQYLVEKQSRLNAILALYDVLGGGWEYEPSEVYEAVASN